MPGDADIAKTVATEAVETWLAQFERALTQPDAVLLSQLFVPDSYWRDVLAFDWRIRTISGADDILHGLQDGAARSHPSGFQDRRRPHTTAPCDARRHRNHRSDIPIRNRPGPRQRHRAARSTIRQGLDAAHHARRDQGARRKARTLPPRGQSLFTRFPRTELARCAASECRVQRSRPRCSGYWRRTGRTVGCGMSRTIADRHADRRPWRTHRRQLAQPLSRAGPAQSGERQSPALHALSAELAGLHPERQDRRLVRGLCRKPGAQHLDRHRIRKCDIR